MQHTVHSNDIIRNKNRWRKATNFRVGRNAIPPMTEDYETKDHIGSLQLKQHFT